MKNKTSYNRYEIDGKKYLVEIEVRKVSINSYDIIFTFYKNVGFVRHRIVDEDIKLQ